MAKKTLTQELKETKKQLAKTERDLQTSFSTQSNLRLRLAEAKAPTSKDKQAEYACKKLADLARFETILQEWNWTGQLNLVRSLVQTYKDSGFVVESK